MFRPLVLLLLLMGGCAVHTTEARPDRGTGTPAGVERLPRVGFLPIRVGVEYLPPDDAARRDDPAEPGTRGAQDPRRANGRRPASRVVAESIRPRTRDAVPAGGLETRWSLDRAEVDAIDDSAEQLALRFVSDLIGEDKRRMQRELGTPILTTRLRHRTSPTLRNQLDDREAEEEAAFVNDVAPRLVRRPLLNALKHATLISDLEDAFEDFKADNVPLSGAFMEHQGRSRWGRVSMRLSLSDGSDPVELSYVNWGWRIGSSQEHLRLVYTFDLVPSLRTNLRLKYDYLSHDTELRADLQYDIDENTRLHMLAADRMEFLSGPTAYSFVNSPIDGIPGFLFYVEHLF